MPLSTTYTKVETDYKLQELQKFTASGIKGELSISDPAPTVQGLYILSDIDTYTNLGGIVTTAGKVNYAYFDGTTWKLIAVEMPHSKIPTWNAQTYVMGSQVLKYGHIWENPNSSAISTDVPGVSDKWVQVDSKTVTEFFDFNNIVAYGSYENGVFIPDSGVQAWGITDMIPIKKNSIIKIQAYGESVMYAGHLFDKNNNYVKEIGRLVGTNTLSNTTDIMPFDGYVIFQNRIYNGKKDYSFVIKYDDINITQSTTEFFDFNNTEFFDFNNIVSYGNYENGVFIPDSGVHGWGITDMIPIKKNSIIKIQAYGNFGMYAGQLFDKNNNHVKEIGRLVGEDTLSNTTDIMPFDGYVIFQNRIYNGKKDYSFFIKYDDKNITQSTFEDYVKSLTYNNEGYLLSYFGKDNVGQNLRLGYSIDGESFYNFAEYIPSNENTIRDPSIIYFNDWFYVIHTNTPYGSAEAFQKANIIKSKDLINWYNVARVGTDNIYNWAPEFFVDGADVYAIISIPTGGNFQPFIFKAMNAELTQWDNGIQLLGDFNNISCIDHFIIKINSIYYLISKNESNKYLNIYKSNSLLTGYTMFKDGATNWADISQQTEGQCALMIDEDTIRIYADGLPPIGQGLRSQDFDINFVPKSEIKFVPIDTESRHGTVIKVVGINKFIEKSNLTIDNVPDTATASNPQSILDELRLLKMGLINNGLMKL